MIVLILLTPARQRPLVASVATIGTFDGVHVGHRSLFSRAIELGQKLGVPTVAVTFHPHPASVIRPEKTPLLLNSFEERLSLIDEVGIDYCYLVEFDAARAGEIAQDFVRGTLVSDLGVKAVVVGPDFRFGKNRIGDVNLLKSMGETMAFEVYADPFVVAQGRCAAVARRLLPGTDENSDVVISSTLIRKMILGGQFDVARQCLDRDFFISGLVVSGDGRGGSELGYPTANVNFQEGRILPDDGVYAGWLRFGAESYPSAISIGTRPTFYGDRGQRLIEAFVLDFNEDLYGRDVTVGFTEFIRPQLAFSSSTELVEQIASDVERVREISRRHLEIT